MQASKERGIKNVVGWKIINLIKALFIKSELTWEFLTGEKNYAGAISWKVLFQEV